MLRKNLALLFFAFASGAVLADEIETVRSWEHYRELMLLDGTPEAEADRPAMTASACRPPLSFSTGG